METNASSTFPSGRGNVDAAMLADTVFSSLLVLTALHWKQKHGIGEALRLWDGLDSGRITLHFDVMTHTSHTIIKGFMHEAGDPEVAKSELMTLTLLPAEVQPGGGGRGCH